MSQKSNLPDHVAADSPKAITNATIAPGGAIKALVPQSLDDTFRLSKALAGAGNMVPEHFQGKPDAIMAAIVRGMEIGLAPMQSLSNIAVINGRASLWGDALPALMQRAGNQIDVKYEGEGDAFKAVATLTRGDTGQQITREFSVDDAKKANLWNKKGPWQQYPKRMLSNRARSWAVRDGAADALMGLQVAEEVQDYQPMKTVRPADSGGWAAKAINARDPQPAQQTTQQQDEPITGEILPDDEQTEVEQSTDQGGDAEPDQTFEFDEGVTAFGQGKASSECPYEEPPQSTDWVGGWNQAYNDQEGGDE